MFELFSKPRVNISMVHRDNGYSGIRLHSFESEVVYAWQKKRRAKEERD